MSRLNLFNETYRLLETSVDISARRHRLITSNIANMDTMFYKPKDMDFLDTLDKAMQAPPKPVIKTHKKHMTRPQNPLEMLTQQRTSIKNRYHLDSVDIDTEMTNLVENNVKYRTSIEFLLRKVTILRQSIAEGGR